MFNATGVPQNKIKHASLNIILSVYVSVDFQAM